MCHYVSSIYLLIPWSTVVLEKLTCSKLVKKFPTFYGTRRFIAAFTWPYPESARSNPYPTSLFLTIHLIIILPSTPGFAQWTLSLSLTHQDPVHPSPHPIRATCAAHLILLAFITHTIFCEQYRTSSSSLCCFLHSPVTSSLLRIKQLNIYF